MMVREKMSLPKIESIRSAGVGAPSSVRAGVVTSGWTSGRRVDGKGDKIIEQAENSHGGDCRLRRVRWLGPNHAGSRRPIPPGHPGSRDRRRLGQRIIDVGKIGLGQLDVDRIR